MKIIEKCAFAILKVHLLPRLDPPLEVDERRVVVVGRTAGLAEVAAALARRGPHETSSLRPIPLLFFKNSCPLQKMQMSSVMGAGGIVET